MNSIKSLVLVMETRWVFWKAGNEILTDRLAFLYPVRTAQYTLRLGYTNQPVNAVEGNKLFVLRSTQNT